jgi:tetratricopeptide (TPR) repeat protein
LNALFEIAVSKNWKFVLRQFPIIGSFVIATLPVIASGPRDEDVLRDVFHKSLEWEQRGDLKAALASLNTLGPMAARSYVVQLRTGWLCFKANEHGESRRHYWEAAQLSPLSIEARLGLIQPLQAEGRYSDIEAVAKEILQIDRGNYPAGLRLISALRLQKKTGAAQSQLMQMLRHFPCDLDVLNAFNDVTGHAPDPHIRDLRAKFDESNRQETAHDYAAAIAVIQPVVFKDPNDYCGNLRLAWLYSVTSNNVKSVRCSELAIRAVPNSVEARLGLIPALMAQQRWDELEAAMKQVVTIDPLNFIANWRLATACRMRGKCDRAARVASDMLSYYPADENLLTELAQARAAQNDVAGAMDAYKQVAIIAPYNAAATQFFARVSAGRR